MTAPTDPAREKRNSVIVRAMVQTPDGAADDLRVRNLSRSGACLEHGGQLRDGMTVHMHLGTIDDLVGHIVWATDRLAGVRFEETVDLEEARKPRGIRAVPKAGWMSNINDAYRR